VDATLSAEFRGRLAKACDDFTFSVRERWAAELMD